MPSFNANAFMAKATTRINELSDQLAFEIGERLNESTTDEMTAMMEELLAIVRNKDATQRLIHGEFAQNNAGQPALQLGGGSTSHGQITDSSKAYAVIQADPDVDSAIKQALRRIMIDKDPQYIPVDRNGTPTEIIGLEKQVKDLKAERDAAQDELAKERDPKKTGSLAEQLEAAKKATSAPAPADMVKKDDVKKAVDMVKKAVGELGAQRKGLGAELTGKPELDKAVGELDKLTY